MFQYLILVRGVLVILTIKTLVFILLTFKQRLEKPITIQTIQKFEDDRTNELAGGNVKFLGITQAKSNETNAVLKLGHLKEIGDLYFALRKDQILLSQQNNGFRSQRLFSKKDETYFSQDNNEFKPQIGDRTISYQEVPLHTLVIGHGNSLHELKRLSPVIQKGALTPLILKDEVKVDVKKWVPAGKAKPLSKAVIHGATQKQTNSAMKTILFWNTFYGNPFYYLGKTWPGSYCSQKKCTFTHDKEVVGSADAVLFHMWPADKWTEPKSRTEKQRYVFFLSESPSSSNYQLEKFNNFFNLTMTYQHDSDVPFLYGDVEKRKTRLPDSSPGWLLNLSKMKEKTRPVAWIVSHCKTDSLREKYVQELQKHIKVDIYGKCGILQCLPKMSKKCYNMIERKYKFVLAFENSICKDYVTEKFFNNAKHHIVTVAYGGADYKKIMPPNSYIDTNDFKSPKDLAMFLLKLHHDDAAYLKYLEWQKEYNITLSSIEWRRAFCRLCDILHNKNFPKQSYTSDDLVTYWGNQTCKAPRLISKYV